METKICKPIKELNFDRLKELIFEYREIKTILGYEELPYEICVGDDFIFASDWVQEKLVELLEKRLEILESEINVLGYTMQDEPKEWQYHVNVLKGEDDE